MNNQVILVDEHDKQIGLMDKLEAHRGEGRLHRAISVLLWRQGKNGKEVLLQKRAPSKPLWPLFWTNTICTHPRDSESELECAVRRLDEEMGIKIGKTDLELLFKLPYQAKYSDEYSEHELDGVIVGRWDGMPKSNPDEVADWKWVSWLYLLSELKTSSVKYTPWLRQICAEEQLKNLLV